MRCLEDKLKYFLIGLIMLLVVVMFRDNFALEKDYVYDNCDHEFHNDLVNAAYNEADGTHHDATYHAYWTGSTFTHSDPNKYWWFTDSDLLEFSGKYYCMFAGKSMHSFESSPGWVTHYDTHRSEAPIDTKHWYTNYYWENGWVNSFNFTETAGCVMYNYNSDPHSETKRGQLGIQAAIWAEGSGEIGGGLDESHAQSVGFSGKQEYYDERKFYNIEAHENITIENVVGKTLPLSPIEGLLPDEEFYMYLDFPIIFGSVPTGIKNGTTTTYEGEFGKIAITNGTLVKVPSNKAITGNYQYTIKINTGDLSSNVVDIDVTKYYYDYNVEIKYSNCVNNTNPQPVGTDGSYSRSNRHEGKTVTTKAKNFSFRINSDVAIKHYIYSIGGETHYNDGGMVADSGLGGRKTWNTADKLAKPAVGELGDEIIYKIIVENYTKANVYVNIEDILPPEAMFVSATHGGSGNPVNWKLLPMPEAESPTSPGNPTPNTKEITLIARMNIANYDKAISTAKIVKVFATKAETYKMTNIANPDADTTLNAKQKEKLKEGRTQRIVEDEDAFTTKKYDISIDQYIAQVNHQETRGGTGVTYSAESRARRKDDWKLDDPVFVEYGDIITYKFVLYNTNYDVTNGSTPWFNPDTVFADLSFELPKKYELRSISSTDSYNGYNHNGGKIEFSRVRIGRDSKTTITLTLVAEEVQKDITETTTLWLTEVYNRNGRNTHEANPIENTSGRTEVKERYKISHYDAILDEYIFTYNAEMAEYNDTYAFTDGEFNQKYVEENRTYSNKSPLEVEKYETLCYKTIVTNNYKNAEREDTPESYKQYNTRIRPTIVKQTIDYGLTQYQYQIWWHHASSGRDELVGRDENQSRIVQTLRDTGSQWIYEYEILDEEIILSPGDYLYYLSFVEVTESNMSLRNLEFKSEIKELTNINRKNKFNISHNGEVIAHTSNMKNDKVELISIEQTNPSENSDLIFTFKIRDICNTIENENCKKGICFGYATPTGTGCKVNKWKENGQLYCSVQIHLGDRGSNHDTRMVTDENVAKPNHVSRNNFVRLKDLIISGTVWVDENRDGYYKEESGKNNVKVKVTLYSNYYSDRKDEEGNDIWEYHGNNYKKVAEIDTVRNEKTNSDGYYNFGRCLKAQKDSNGNYINEHIKYFVEFEYYGQMYKATEVYGGINEGQTHGTGNLSIGGTATNNTISYWRRGYDDLPTSQSITYKEQELGVIGREQYMTDSNAYEFDNVRYEFDDANKTVGYHYAYRGLGEDNRTSELNYEKKDHTSTLQEDTTQNSTRMTARSFIVQDYTSTINGDSWENRFQKRKNGQIEILTATGTTKPLSLYGYEYSNSYNYPRADGVTDKPTFKTEREKVVETEYLKYINLGLVRREEVDLSMESDVYSVKTTINGEEMIYDYNANNADSTNYDEPKPVQAQGESNSDFEKRKKAYEEAHKNDYSLEKAYDLDLYTTDYYYRTDYYKNEESKVVQKYKENAGGTNDLDKNPSELNTEVTYRVRITNNIITGDEPHVDKEEKTDIPVETAINELTIYYDKNFMKADNTSTVTVKEKNSGTGLLEDHTQRISGINYKTNTGNTGELTINDNAGYPNAKGQLHDEYQVMYLTGIEDLYLKEGEFIDVYITLTVDKEADTRNLKITEDDDMGLELISEISAYTTRYKPNTNSENEDPNGYFHQGLAGRYAALVDKDSEPGNLLEYDRDVYNDYRDYDNYEDDTYKAGIKVGLLDDPTPTPPPERKSSTERIITGMVWDDARSKAESGNETAVQYLGNGEYITTDENYNDENGAKAATNPNVSHNNDKLVEGVKVSLIEVVQTTQADENGQAKYYEYPARYTYDVYNKNNDLIHQAGDLIETKTDEKGKYQLDHFIPGYYKVRFDYGYNKDSESSIIYNGQDYKSTTYYNEYDGELLYYNEDNSYGDNDNIGSSAKFSYFDKVKNTLLQKNYSDAQDDEIRRLNVNSYSETMTVLQAVIFSDPHRQNENGDSIGNEEKLTKHTHMYAETAIFYVKPENVASEKTNINPLDYSDFNKQRLWRIDDLDFGLEYRPEASILLDKEISTLELVTSDNKTLIKLYFEGEIGNRKINESKSIGYENVQFLPNEGKMQQGFVYINMDTDILEGCTIKVEYEMTATNKSEVDRINENLDAIKYEKGANDKNYGIFKVYTTHQKDENKIEYTYNANQTASELLAHKYYTSYDKKSNISKSGYDYDTLTGSEKYNHLNYLKKPYTTDNTTTIDNVELKGQEYYGMYLGQTYYTGVKGDDVVAQLKVDHILDYVDNDFTFALSENNTKNRLWSSTTSEELQENNLIDWNNVHKIKEGANNYLIDRKGIRYDTDNKTNLALSVDDNKKGNLEDNRKKGNITLSRFLETVWENKEAKNTYGQISAIATKVISADDVSQGKGLAYENISEVIQFTNITGRRTTLPKKNTQDEIRGGGVIGNANVEKWTGANKYEDDTDATEIITISPPTGLTQ